MTHNLQLNRLNNNTYDILYPKILDSDVVLTNNLDHTSNQNLSDALISLKNSLPDVQSVVQATPQITVSSSGLITVTSTQQEGLVLAGEKTVTNQLSTIPASTYTPVTTDTVLSAGSYITGTQVVQGDSNLLADNIKENVNIFGVTGKAGAKFEMTVNTLTITLVNQCTGYDARLLMFTMGNADQSNLPDDFKYNDTYHPGMRLYVSQAHGGENYSMTETVPFTSRVYVALANVKSTTKISASVSPSSYVQNSNVISNCLYFVDMKPTDRSRSITITAHLYS